MQVAVHHWDSGSPYAGSWRRALASLADSVLQLVTAMMFIFLAFLSDGTLLVRKGAVFQVSGAYAEAI
jgi:hypothetical protein